MSLNEGRGTGCRNRVIIDPREGVPQDVLDRLGRPSIGASSCLRKTSGGFGGQSPPAKQARLRPQGDLAPWRTVRDAIGDMPEPASLAAAKARGSVERSDWHVVRDLSPENVERIRAARAGETWTHTPEHLRPDCHRNGYVGFTNVYGRMEWDRPSPTITGGCTTFSKGRFGHPTADRTISVREAALLQTFPRDYRFDTPFMDYVCSMIGNALPCAFAEALSRQCVEQLRKH